MQAIQLDSSRYRYVSHLETGSDSEVFCARVDGAFGFEKLVAVKRLRLPRPEGDDARTRLIRHAVICSKLSHHNVVGVYDFYQDDTGLCLAMEMVEGASLAAIVRRQRELGKPIAISTILSVAAQLLEVLDYLHHARDPMTRKPLRLVHRDLNPKSIMVDRTGVVKLLGFGRARCGVLPDTIPLWKSNYVAPEVSGGTPADPSADIFSVGTILYEMMTLKPLFSAPPSLEQGGRRARLEVEAWIELLPRPYQALRTILLRAVALSRAERYASAARMADDLRPFVVPTTRSLPPDLGLRLAATAAMSKRRREGAGGEAILRAEVSVSDGRRLPTGVVGVHVGVSPDESADPTDVVAGRSGGAVASAQAAEAPRGAGNSGTAEPDRESVSEDLREDERETEVGAVARLAPRAVSHAADGDAAGLEQHRGVWGELGRPEDVPEGEGPVARPAWVRVDEDRTTSSGPAPAASLGSSRSGANGRARDEAPVAGQSQPAGGPPGSVGQGSPAGDGDESDLVEAETLEARGWTSDDTPIPSPRSSLDPGQVTVEADTDAGDGLANRPERGASPLVSRQAPGRADQEEPAAPEFKEGLSGEQPPVDDEPDVLTRRSSLSDVTRETPMVLDGRASDPESRDGRECTAPSSYHRALVNIAQAYATAKTPPPHGVPVSPNDTVEAPLAVREGAPRKTAGPPAEASVEASVEASAEASPKPASARPDIAARPPFSSAPPHDMPAGSARDPYKQTLDLPLPSRSGLVLLFIDPHPGLKCNVPQTGLTIGRSPASDLVIGHHRVAWHHARIEWAGGRWWMKADPPAFLRLDGLKVERIPLQAGQFIEIGGAKLSVLDEGVQASGAVIDFAALTLDLVARFRHLILDPAFRARAGVRLDPDTLKAPPSRLWKIVLDDLRKADAVPGLARLLDALLEIDPDAAVVRRSRACLDLLEMSVPPVADQETLSLSGRER